MIVADLGRPAEEILNRKAATRRGRLLIAMQLAQVLWALAERGLRLPDARVGRFLANSGAHPVLLLADLGGIQSGEPGLAVRKHAGLVFGACRQLLEPVEGELPGALLRLLHSRRSRVEDLLRELALAL